MGLKSRFKNYFNSKIFIYINIKRVFLILENGIGILKMK